MKLNRENLAKIHAPAIEIPGDNMFALPEKVLQFGTGVLLRCLPDYFIDKANKQGLFNGRILMVKSTDSDSSAFDRQDGLFTLCERGIDKGERIIQNSINASISRVLSAKDDWEKILECARNPQMSIIISNTTEVGIVTSHDRVSDNPPSSFPGKLLSFLYARFRFFNGAADKGMVIVPTELITDNGAKLKNIVLELAGQDNLSPSFINWLKDHNHFCNSLVDRIVPGRPGEQVISEIENTLGYTDELLCMSEVFRLWAIEGDEKIKEALSFSTVDEGVIIQPDITLFKELKLRLLNGTHSFNCGLAYLCGFTITREAMADNMFSEFAKKLMYSEIAPSIPFTIRAEVKNDFAKKVMDRFCNPFIDHQWLSITVQYTSKMKMRNIPLLQTHYAASDEVPLHMAAGFAGYLLFLKIVKEENGKYYGMRKDLLYEVKDDAAPYYFNLWNTQDLENVVDEVMRNEELWGMDMTSFPGFGQAVKSLLKSMVESGVRQTLEELLSEKRIVDEA